MVTPPILTGYPVKGTRHMLRWPTMTLLVSTALLFGCAPNFDDAAERCAAMGEESGTSEYAECVKRMRKVIAEEQKYRKSFCYTVSDRVVCEKDPLHAQDAPSKTRAKAGK